MSDNELVSLEGKTAIVAVEEVDACEYMQKIVQDGGLTVITANDGQVALDLIKTRKPNVAILDVGLPTIFGFDICSMIKKDEELGDVKIILMASVYDSAAYKRGPSSLYGADDYIERHHVKSDLVDKVKAVLSGEHYISEKKEKEEFVPFSGTEDEVTEESSITLDSNDTKDAGLPALGAVDTTMAEEKVEASTPEEEGSGLSIPPMDLSGGGAGGQDDLSEEVERSAPVDTGLELGGASSDGHEDLSEEGEVSVPVDTGLELGGASSGGHEDLSEEGEVSVPVDTGLELGDDSAESEELSSEAPTEEPASIPEPAPIPAPVAAKVEEEAEPASIPAPVDSEPAPPPVKKVPYSLDEAKLAVNAKEILASDDNVEEKARKLARVVVSDIFLYNSEHVDVGIREGTFYKLIKEDLRDGIKYMKKKIPKHLPSDQILKDAFDEYIIKRKEMMDK